jgi:hypothetical protein
LVRLRQLVVSPLEALALPAGWDSDLIHLIFSSNMVTSLLSVLQEKGRAGRRVGADGSDDTYFVGFDLEDYLYLVKRACAGEASTDIDLADFESLDTTLPEYTKLQSSTIESSRIEFVHETKLP